MAASASKVKEKETTAKYISWRDFQRRYLTREDKYRYEWLNGVVEKTEQTMDQTQLRILKNLLKFFTLLEIEGKVNGVLGPETDTFFKQNHRRPDFAYFSEEQIDRADLGENQLPLFVIEVISTNDGMNRVHRKMNDYWNAGVEVIWHILPLLQEVHVYHGRNMVVCKGEDLCSAAPVIPAFEISVNDIFKKNV